MSDGSKITYELSNNIVAHGIVKIDSQGSPEEYLTIHKVGSENTTHFEKIDGVFNTCVKPAIRTYEQNNFHEIVNSSDVFYLNTHCIVRHVTNISDSLKFVNYFVQINELSKLESIREELGATEDNFLQAYYFLADSTAEDMLDVSKIEVRWSDTFSEYIKQQL